MSASVAKYIGGLYKLIVTPPNALSYTQTLPSILGDDRFKVMFENPEYQVDEQSEEFRLLNPIVSNVEKKRIKKLRQMATTQQVRLNLVVALVVTDTTMGSFYCVISIVRTLRITFEQLSRWLKMRRSLRE